MRDGDGALNNTDSTLSCLPKRCRLTGRFQIARPFKMFKAPVQCTRQNAYHFKQKFFFFSMIILKRFSNKKVKVENLKFKN